MPLRIENLCREKGLKMTEQRRVIARVISESDDHPTVQELYERAKASDDSISLATLYRTIKLFEDAGILDKHDFGGSSARYEEISDEHHDHLIDVDTGEVVEFTNEQIERLQEVVARQLGYRLVGHRLELYGVKVGGGKPSS